MAGDRVQVLVVGWEDGDRAPLGFLCEGGQRLDEALLVRGRIRCESPLSVARPVAKCPGTVVDG